MITPPPLARARLAVASPMPELPPITTTVCPSSSGSRCGGGAAVVVSMVPYSDPSPAMQETGEQVIQMLHGSRPEDRAVTTALQRLADDLLGFSGGVPVG